MPETNESGAELKARYRNETPRGDGLRRPAYFDVADG
jgi:hypothetical protein